MNRKKSQLYKLSLMAAAMFMLAAVLTSCPTNEKFGPDADYFIGLQKLNEGNVKEAVQKFNNCIKKGSLYCARESAKQLAHLGNLQEKNSAAEFLYKNFPGQDSKLILAQQYLESNELRKLVELTNDLDFSNDQDALIKVRLLALQRLKLEDRFFDEVYTWFTSRQLSQEQYQFYRDIYSPLIESMVSEEAYEPTPRNFALSYRFYIYRRDYLSGYALAGQLLSYFEHGELSPCAMLASDLGKSFLYGSEQIVQDAVFLRKEAEMLKDTPAEFYMWFYAARLYDGANLYYRQASTCYENAIASTDDPSKKDNALWYLMKTNLKLSLDRTLESISDYARQWDDPEYFEDFFDTLIPSLIVNAKWSAFEPLLQALDGYATKETLSQIAYIYGRLIQEGFIELDADKKEESLKKAYEKALDSGTNTYYRVMAAYRLGLSGQELDAVLGQGGSSLLPQAEESIKEATPADNLLNGYAFFGFREKIYDNWLSYYKEDLAPQTGFYLSAFLKKCGDEDDVYYSQALRIAARSLNMSSSTVSKEDLKNVYPQNYSELVDTYAKKYDISSSVIYALIRSESFFDKEIVSSAGAVGLTQLMSPTAGEIAQKLKIKEYELTDPQTNIMFGTYYLAELIRRGEGSLLRAFFSYNAGFRKVTTWLNSSMLEFGKTNSLDMDLFLETVPVSETREYGRKLIGATVMYEYLYNNADFSKTVEGLLK